jgi:hypothetical protein
MSPSPAKPAPRSPAWVPPASEPKALAEWIDHQCDRVKSGPALQQVLEQALPELLASTLPETRDDEGSAAATLTRALIERFKEMPSDIDLPVTVDPTSGWMTVMHRLVADGEAAHPAFGVAASRLIPPAPWEGSTNVLRACARIVNDGSWDDGAFAEMAIRRWQGAGHHMDPVRREMADWWSRGLGQLDENSWDLMGNLIASGVIDRATMKAMGQPWITACAVGMSSGESYAGLAAQWLAMLGDGPPG